MFKAVGNEWCAFLVLKFVFLFRRLQADDCKRENTIDWDFVEGVDLAGMQLCGLVLEEDIGSFLISKKNSIFEN